MNKTRCAEGLRLYLAWVETSTRVKDILLAGGVTGREMLTAQEEDPNYKRQLKAYRAHYSSCPQCRQAIQQMAYHPTEETIYE